MTKNKESNIVDPDTLQATDEANEKWVEKWNKAIKKNED